MIGEPLPPYILQCLIFPSFDLIPLNYHDIKKIIPYYYSYEKKFDKAEIDMDKQLSFTPIITYYEYQKAYFSVHRLISYFFDENWGTPKYETTYINKIKN